MFGFLKKKKSAEIAKDRLTIAIMSDRSQNDYPFMEDLKKDIIEVVKKYINVKEINVKKEAQDELEAISIDLVLDK